MSNIVSRGNITLEIPPQISCIILILGKCLKIYLKSDHLHNFTVNVHIENLNTSACMVSHSNWAPFATNTIKYRTEI